MPLKLGCTHFFFAETGPIDGTSQDNAPGQHVPLVTPAEPQSEVTQDQA